MTLQKLLFLLVAFLTPINAIVLPSEPVMAAGQAAPIEPSSGSTICLPDAYLVEPGDCLALGPSQTLTELAKSGESYPGAPLPAAHPSPDWKKSPVSIARYNGDPLKPIPVYATLEDAVAAANPVGSIAPGRGLHYVSYINVVRVGGKPYVQLKSGEWVRASPAGYSPFQGLLFTHTPSTGFGWAFDNIRPRSAPQFTAPEVGELIPKESPIQIYETVETDGMEWYRVGPDAWVPYHKARRARVSTTPPQGVKGDRWISVDLFDQILMVYENRQLVFATLIASGAKPYYTRPGTFQIYKKKPLETMTGAFEADKLDYYYLEDVPWTMYFDQARALHGAYWRAWFGLPQSAGCVNLSLGDSNWLFQWAKEGDWVYVWDASGKTPTDPSFYGAGGA